MFLVQRLQCQQLRSSMHSHFLWFTCARPCHCCTLLLGAARSRMCFQGWLATPAWQAPVECCSQQQGVAAANPSGHDVMQQVMSRAAPGAYVLPIGIHTPGAPWLLWVTPGSGPNCVFVFVCVSQVGVRFRWRRGAGLTTWGALAAPFVTALITPVASSRVGCRGVLFVPLAGCDRVPGGVLCTNHRQAVIARGHVYFLAGAAAAASRWSGWCGPWTWPLPPLPPPVHRWGASAMFKP